MRGAFAATGISWLALGASCLTSGAEARSADPTITWQPCPHYSAKVVRYLNYSDVARFRRLMARTDCGTLRVPLDYDRPGGHQITIALTRLRASDRAHRLGSLALNQTGVGNSGYMMPFELLLSTSGGDDAAAIRATNRKLHKRYDLIGFDPRGVGYSTTYDCSRLPGENGPLPSGPDAEHQARQVFAAQVSDNRACANSKPRFLANLTTVNAARDLNRIRRALGERKLSYLGELRGTWLGAVYRSLFPAHVSRMWLESVMRPQPRQDLLAADRAEATAMDFSRLAAWIASHNDEYGFGSTGEQVETALAQLRQSYDDSPRKFTDLDRPLDGATVAELAASPTKVGWSTVAEALAALRDATGPTAPPIIKEMFDRGGGGGGSGGDTPPSGLPEGSNPTMDQALSCNQDKRPRDFESAWAAYQQRLQLYPVTGRVSSFVPLCAGWQLPAHRLPLRRSRGSLVLSGHRYAAEAPYKWTQAMQSAIGGTVFTVKDDVPASALHEPECVRRIVAYFITGHPGRDACPGYRGTGKGL